MKILITAASGKVGSELAKILSARGVTHVLGLRDPSKAPKSSVAVAFDYRDNKTWKPALVGIDAIWLASVGDQEAAPEIAFVDLAKASGVKRIVKLGAMGIENTDVPHRQVEKHIEKSGLEWTFLHPTWFYQNYSTGQAGNIQNGFFAEPAGDTWTAFIDARDIAEAAANVLTRDGHQGKTYTLTGADKLTKNQLAEAISAHIGKKIEYRNISDADFRAAMKPYLTPQYVDLLSNLYEGVRAGWTQHVSDDAEKVLGRKPYGVKDFLSAYGSVFV